MKKRLLISSVLMSAVLACALGTGTYAWYAASGGAGASVNSTGTTTGTLETASAAGTIGAYELSITVTPSGSIQLSNDDGVSYVMVGTQAVQAATQNVTGTYTVDVKWADEVDGYTGADYNDEAKKELKGDYTFTITAEGCAKLLDDEGATEDDIVASHLVRVNISEQGVVTITSGATGRYAIRAKSTNAVEQTTDHAADKLVAAWNGVGQPS